MGADASIHYELHAFVGASLEEDQSALISRRARKEVRIVELWKDRNGSREWKVGTKFDRGKTEGKGDGVVEGEDGASGGGGFEEVVFGGGRR